MTSLFHFPVSPSARPEDAESRNFLALWRAPTVEDLTAQLTEPAILAALGDAVECIRPLVFEVARALEGAETSEMIRVLLGEKTGGKTAAADSLATDLLASALLLGGRDGDATARVAVDYLRRQRALDPLEWRAFARRPSRSPSYAKARARAGETVASLP